MDCSPNFQSVKPFIGNWMLYWKTWSVNVKIPSLWEILTTGLARILNLRAILYKKCGTITKTLLNSQSSKVGMSKIYQTHGWPTRLNADVKRVFGKNEGVVWMQNPNEIPQVFHKLIKFLIPWMTATRVMWREDEIFS